jgi:uncharacterized protein (DUF305 family)
VTVASERTTPATGSTAGRPGLRRGLALVAGLALLVLGLALGLLLGGSEEAGPSEGSVEAGFARDMSVHHGQAVEMATTILLRTDDPVLGSVARDMALTQQAQIGRMQGWLAAWELPPTGSEPAMAWMRHLGDEHAGHGLTDDGRMPGMASPEDLDRLRTEPTAAAEVLFLELMTVHHVAGVDMAQAALEGTEEPDVVLLAESMVRSQQAEIDVMSDLLAARGAAPAAGAQAPEPDEPHAGHGG